MEQHYERWRTWLDALRLHGSLISIDSREDDDDSLQSGVIWIKWTRLSSINEDAVDAAAELAYEALELLAILSQIDQPTWRELVATVWTNASEYWLDAPPSQCFQLGCAVGVWRLGALGKWCARMLLDDITSMVSEQYDEMRTELEHQLGTQKQLDLKVPVRLEIVDEIGHETDDLTALLFEIVQLVALQAAQDRISVGYTSKWERLFCIQEVALVGYFPHHSQRDFQYLRQIAAYGVHMDTLRLVTMDITEATAPVYVPMLHQFLDTGYSSPTESTAEHMGSTIPVENAFIEMHSTSQSYDGIFSAVRESRSLRLVSVFMHDEIVVNRANLRSSHRDRLWQWIAAVLFSPRTTSSVEDLYFHAAELTMEDVAIVESVLCEPHPMLALFRGWAVDTNGSVVLTASSFRLLSPFAEDVGATVGHAPPLSPLTLAAPVHNLHVINTPETENSEWLCVLLPGWGQAWVKRCDATIAKSIPVNPGTNQERTGHPVRRLRIDSPASNDKYAVLRILRAAGTNLKRLELINWEEPEDPDTAWLRCILLACPQLDTFELTCMPIQSLTMFAQFYTENALCRISHLRLTGVSIRDIHTNPSPFFDALADDHHPMSRQLLELEIDTQRLPRMPLGMATAIANMFEHNHRLCRVDLKLRVASNRIDNADRDEIDAMMELPTTYHGEPVAVRQGPLPLEKKLAFLSAVWGQRDLQALDSSVVALVFQFAAECRTRHVAVKCVSVKLEHRMRMFE